MANRTAADAMLTHPKVCGPATTVGQAREMLRDDHVHALLVVAGGRLLSVVERADVGLGAPDAPARDVGGLVGRVVAADADLGTTAREMRERGRRRLAVVDDAGALLGLLCLKRSGRGFCDDDGVAARAADRRR